MMLLGILAFWPKEGWSQEDLPVGDSILLEEAWAVTLPGSPEIIDVAVGPRGEILLQTTGALLFLPSRSGSIQRLGSFQTLEIVGNWTDGRKIELFDRNTGRVVRLRQPDLSRSWDEIRPSRSVESAAKSNCGWVTVSPSGGDPKRFVVRFGDQGQRLTESGLSWEGVIVSAFGDLVFLTETLPPFRGMAINCTNPMETVQELEIPHASETKARSWRSLPLFPFQNRLVRTLADLSTDARRFVIYDHHGRIVRLRQTSAPIGLVASIPGDTLLAVRRLDRVELVGFAIVR